MKVEVLLTVIAIFGFLFIEVYTSNQIETLQTQVEELTASKEAMMEVIICQEFTPEKECLRINN